MLVPKQIVTYALIVRYICAYSKIIEMVHCVVFNFQTVLVNYNQIVWITSIDSESGGTEEGLGGTPVQVSI